MAKSEIKNFRRIVWDFYKKNGRHDLPWRQTRDPYKILVSEVMLQQTQVERVIPFYKNFVKKYPTARRLAAAPLFDVLKSWQGLGYNRRAKHLHQAAKKFSRLNLNASSQRFNLTELPGVGPYTARAIAAFAYNQDVVFVETNIRTAIIHHFYPQRKKVNDREIEKALTRALPSGRAREWYSALMDYGAYLKHSGISHNAKSRTYTKQSKFAGSLREARGAILRALAQMRQGLALPREDVLVNLLGPSRRAQLQVALLALLAEGLIKKNHVRYSLAD